MDQPTWTRGAPYIFVIYAHEDADSVQLEIDWLHDQEFNIRGDINIHADDAWSQGLAEAIEQAALILCFVSPHSMSSAGFRKIIEYATENNPQRLDVHFQEAQLQSDVAQSIRETATILKYDLADDAYREKLISGLMMQASATRIQPISTPAMPVMHEKGAPNIFQHALVALAIVVLGILVYVFLAP
ncbi:MAG: toll/interleukin-1 receptor domain-containing protein [Gammaproteobacteria bacterium]|nr:toll/interleukin-1 receptor domain-containing protein [Gammaproteobacteria bacterium]